MGANSTTITLTLSDDQRQMINVMAVPQLDIEEGAVTDIAGNMISAAPDQPIIMIDGMPPTVVSATYDMGTGALNITFSEPLGSTITYSGIKLAGENGNVALDGVSTKSHSGENITATLDTAQRTTAGDTMTLLVSEGAVADPSNNGIAQTATSVDMTDGIPPLVVSSSYNIDTGIMNITFSEPLDPTTIHYDRLHIRDAGRSSGGLSLGDVTTRALDSSMTLITLTLSSTQLVDVNAMATPQLDVEADAVADPTGNGIAAAPDQDITIIDDTPPVLLSSSYNVDTGILSITFSEPLNHAATDYTLLSLLGPSANITRPRWEDRTPPSTQPYRRA